MKTFIVKTWVEKRYQKLNINININSNGNNRNNNNHNYNRIQLDNEKCR